MRLAATLLFALTLTGCIMPGRDTPPIEIIPDMKHQQKYKPQTYSPLFSDGRASRKPPEGTIAIGQLYADEGYHLGLVNKQYIGRNPEKINKELLLHGQTKFNTYCSPCHDRAGSGKGIVALKAGPAFVPGNLLDDRIKQYNDGELFHVASDGRRTMMGYRNQTTDHDRWAIIAYLRALQRAGGAGLDDVPENLRAHLKIQ